MNRVTIDPKAQMPRLVFTRSILNRESSQARRRLTQNGWRMRDGVLIGVIGIAVSGVLIVLGLLRWQGEPGRRLWAGG
jgi:hypothetical protein